LNSNYWIKLLNMVVILFLFITALTLIGFPILINKYLEFSGLKFRNFQMVTIFLYITAIPFTILLLMVKKLCKNLLQKDPFCKSSIKALNIISICGFIEFFLYAISTLVILKNLLSLTMMVAAFMIGLTSLVLSQLVKAAMDIKQENDLII